MIRNHHNTLDKNAMSKGIFSSDLLTFPVSGTILIGWVFTQEALNGDFILQTPMRTPLCWNTRLSRYFFVRMHSL